MKKILFIAAMLMLTGKLYAGNTGNYATWRSTEIAGAVTNFLVSSGTILLKDIQVSSANVGSTFVFNNSTSANMIRSTSTLWYTGELRDRIEIDQTLTKGLMITTTGDSRLFIRWDYQYQIPNGKESLGYR